MRGNAAILRCTIPSFVADFVRVVAWIDEDGQEFVPSSEGNFSGGKNLVWILNDFTSFSPDILKIYLFLF